ncbi:MAG TPA: lytic murein transglycosylase, partial [Thermohalobaculum sp.]|nr:lytic murein transglycosylase [Thermohalobaculum sp.]
MSRCAMHGTRAVLGLAAFLAAGCVTAGGKAPAQTESAAATVAPQPPARPAAAAGTGESAVTPSADFTSWRNGFRQRALAAGISAATFDAAFKGVRVNARVLELNAYQPEFVRPIWEYLEKAVSDTRIADGLARSAEQRATLDRIRDQYGVDLGIVAAIWGIESAYGFNYGSIPVIEALATLAHEGRRRVFAEEQLIAALRILQSGDVTPARLIGSWAGAMGHTQFIPTSYADYAVDFTGDGKRDVWSDDPADALASTANYLARFGWARGEPSVIAATLPAGFDYRLADDTTRRSIAEWQALGVARAGGGTFPASDSVTLLLPAGAGGPAFAAYPNFRVIKRYNNATSYALAVALLGSQLDPSIGFGLTRNMSWPRNDRPLSRGETQELQRRLTALGFPTQGVVLSRGADHRVPVRPELEPADGYPGRPGGFLRQFRRRAALYRHVADYGHLYGRRGARRADDGNFPRRILLGPRAGNHQAHPRNLGRYPDRGLRLLRGADRRARRQ